MDKLNLPNGLSVSGTITVRKTTNYGNVAVYPVCDSAKVFADIAGTATLTPQTIKCIRDLGITVELQQETI